MDINEFKVWSKRLKLLFPKFAEYLDGLDVARRNELSAEWESALSRVEFVDAREALTDILTGEAEPFNQWEYGTWVAHIRKLANAKRSARYDAEHRHTRASLEQPSGSVNLGGIYRQILAIKDAGSDTTDALERLLPVDDTSGPRFRCWKCQDAGFVTLWHLVTMRAIAKGDEIAPRLRKSMVTLCNCDAGRAKVSPEGSRRRVWTEEHVYDETRHCLYGTGDLDELREFVQTMPQRQMEARPNYTQAFAQFNQGS